MSDAEKDRQAGSQGDWQKETPYKEELELVRRSSGLSFSGLLMRRAYYAGRSGDWESYQEEFRKDGKLSVWASIEEGECHDEVEAEDDGRSSVAQDVLRKSTDFSRRITAPNGGAGGATLSYVCPHCHCFPLEDHIWWVSAGHWKKPCSWWCAACAGQYDCKARTESWTTAAAETMTEQSCCTRLRSTQGKQSIGLPSLGGVSACWYDGPSKRGCR